MGLATHSSEVNEAAQEIQRENTAINDDSTSQEFANMTGYKKDHAFVNLKHKEVMAVTEWLIDSGASCHMSPFPMI